MKTSKKDLKANSCKKVGARLAGCARIAVFAGSFDPFTLGHLDIVTRGAALFDKVWVLVAKNSGKKNCFDSLVRARLAKVAVEKLPNVEVAIHDGLSVDFMKSVGATILLRGVRGSADLDMEQSLAWNNKILFEGAETVCLLSAPEHLSISSTAVREILACSEKTTAGQPNSKKRSAKADLADELLADELLADELLADKSFADELLAKFVPAATVPLLKKEFEKRK